MLAPDYAREHVVGLYPQARLAQLPTGHESILELPMETATTTTRHRRMVTHDPRQLDSADYLEKMEPARGLEPRTC